MERNGVRRAAIWESTAKSAVTIYRLPREHIPRALLIVVRIAARNFAVFAASGASLRVWPVVAHIIAEDSIPVFG
jgi:hypothetical protein